MLDSEGSPSAGSTTPLSPTGPKRPWFARLFDFKPQPLTFRSNWSAAETQERLEAIMKDLFQSSIQVESYKRPSFGVKCRYEGGCKSYHLMFLFVEEKATVGYDFVELCSCLLT